MTHSIIVGGTRGLGRVVARHLAEAGHIVSVVGRRDPPASDRASANVRVWVADLLSSETLATTFDEVIAASGAPSYLVFCQRYRGQGDPWEGEIAATLTTTKAIIERLSGRFASEGDRAIVMVSSVFADHVGEGQPVSYHVAKAGLNQLMRWYAARLGRNGIRVNAVTPFTYLKEESQAYYLSNDAMLDIFRSIVPLGRMATTDDIANVIEFLCSPKASYLTGQNIYVDGGLSIMWPEDLVRRREGV